MSAVQFFRKLGDLLLKVYRPAWFIRSDCKLERTIDQIPEHVELLPVCHHVTGRKQKMASKSDGGSSNILSFPETPPEFSIAAHIRENVETAEGLVLMHAFLKIASSEDRKKVIALAERLGARDG